MRNNKEFNYSLALSLKRIPTSLLSTIQRNEQRMNTYNSAVRDVSSTFARNNTLVSEDALHIQEEDPAVGGVHNVQISFNTLDTPILALVIFCKQKLNLVPRMEALQKQHGVYYDNVCYLIAQAIRLLIKNTTIWNFAQTFARFYDYGMEVALFAPIASLAWLQIISAFEARFLFCEAFSRRLQIQHTVTVKKKKRT